MIIIIIKIIIIKIIIKIIIIIIIIKIIINLENIYENDVQKIERKRLFLKIFFYFN